MKHFIGCCIVLWPVLAGYSLAAVSVVSHFRGGDDDNAQIGTSVTTITDIAGQRHLNCTDTPPTPVYANGLYPASTSSVQTPADQGCSSAQGFTFTDNFGYEAFFRIENVSVQDDFFVNGRGSFDGFGFTTKTIGGGIEYRGYFGGVAYLPTGVLAQPGDIVYMAVVRDSGQTRLYFKDIAGNGALDVYNFGAVGPNPAIGGFGIGLNDGFVDDLRVFTFEPGQFDPDQDLLIHQTEPVCAEPQPAIVAWLTGDQDASDLWNTNDGILMNGASAAVPAHVGNGFAFDGEDDHVLIADSPSIDFEHAFTVEAWVNPATLNDPSEVGTIAAKWSNPALERSFAFGISNSGQLFFVVSSGLTEEPVLSDATVPTGQFSHVAATFDRGAIRLYVNGVAEARSVSIQSLGQTDNPLAIGLRKQTNGDRLVFHGIIDEARLYDRAVSDAELAAHFAAGTAGTCKDDTPDEAEDELSTLKFRQHPQDNSAAQAILLGAVAGPPAGTEVSFAMQIACPDSTLSRSCSVTPGVSVRDVYVDEFARLVCEFDPTADTAKARLRYKSPIPLGDLCSSRVVATSGVFRLLDARLKGTLVE